MKMKNEHLTSCKITMSASIKDAMKAIDAGNVHLALVINGRDQLVGVVSDGDVRRGLLSQYNLSDSVSGIVNSNPIFATPSTSSAEIIEMFEEFSLTAIPIVSDEGCVVDLISPFNPVKTQQLQQRKLRNACAVIMAGGEGQRLRPLTERMPKPLLEVGGKPIIERIVENLSSSGLRQIYVSVNYLGQQIEDHLGEGQQYNVDIGYLREEQKLGTGGALSLLPGDVDGDIIVLNGDVIVGTDFSRLLHFHRSSGGEITVAVKSHEVKIPFGVVKLENGSIAGIDEKPTSRSLVNAGIYVLKASVLAYLAEGEHINMTDIIENAIQRGEKILPFYLHETWLDVGTPDQYKVAHDVVRRLDA